MNLLQSVGFLLALVVCVAGVLAITVATGWKSQRKAHFAALAVLIPLFSFTIFVAESVGRVRTFEPLAFQVHMWMAWSGVVTLVAAIASGVLRLAAGTRLPHRVAVASFLLAVVAAVGTGVWMISTSSLKSDAPSDQPSVPEREAPSPFSGRVEAAEGSPLGPRTE